MLRRCVLKNQIIFDRTWKEEEILFTYEPREFQGLDYHNHYA